MGYTLPTPKADEYDIQELSARKAAIEADIQAQQDVLKTNHADLTTPLVDSEGFPRSDIDVWAVRLARVRIIELRNDYKVVLHDLSKALEILYARTHEEASQAFQPVPTQPEPEIPFAKVDGIAPDSPAATAGLLREDLIVSFGHLTKGSFSTSSLQPLANLVSTREGREINVKVLRSGQLTSLVLTPIKGPTGRVTLGCHIVPYSSA